MKMNDIVSESTKRFPDTPEKFKYLNQLLSNETISGENGFVQIRKLIRDSSLDDNCRARLARDPDADLKDLLVDWIKTNMSSALSAYQPPADTGLKSVISNHPNQPEGI